MTLGVNIDHIAVLREARLVNDPDILEALYISTQAGADQITIHLREDRRHIQDIDVENIIKHSKVPVNLECSINPEILDIVCKLKPHRVTLVPEKREEVTTEGGLDIYNNSEAVLNAIEILHEAIIPVSLFIDPNEQAIIESKNLGAEMVELHTGLYSNLWAMKNSSLPHSNHSVKSLQLARFELATELEDAIEALSVSAKLAKEQNLEVAAGHGLNYFNVKEIANIKEISELNIGQSIIARSVFSGLSTAIKDMKALIS